MKISTFALVIFLTFSVGNSAFAQIDTFEDAFDEEGREYLINLIINTMDSIFDLVFELVEEPALQQWSDGLLDKIEKNTVGMINSQLGYVP